MAKKFTILAFVGGGIRGLMSVTILKRLKEYRPDLIRDVDLIAGCSTGSIITSELLAGKTPEEIIHLFTHGELNFYDNMNTDPTAPAYPIKSVYETQDLLHGAKKVGDETRKKVLFVTFNVGGLELVDGIVVPRPWSPWMVTNMLTEADLKDGFDGHVNYPIAKAATSSGSMPGQLNSFEGNVDGAFFNHDPTMAAIALAVHNGHKLEDISAITIGTGLMPDWVAPNTYEWGARQWMDGVPNPFENTTPFLMNQERSSPMLDMCLNGTSDNLMPTLAKLMLGDRFTNLNPRLPCFIPENSTSPQAISLLEDHGNKLDLETAYQLIDKYWPGGSSDQPLEP